MYRTGALFLFSSFTVAAAQLSLTALPSTIPSGFTAKDSAGNIYVAGTTTNAIPLVNPVQGSLSTGNCSDEAPETFSACPTVFLAKLDPTGTKILYSTYLGPNQQYRVSGLAVDGSGNAYVSGTASAPSPASQTTGQAFLFKVNPAGSALVYSLAVAANTSANAVAVDSAGDAYLAGASFDSSFPVLNSTATLPPVKNTFVTNDGGQTWRAINAGVSSQYISAIAIDPSNTAMLYAGAPTGLFQSLNSGATWTQLFPAATSVQEILIDPKNPSTIYILYGPTTQPTQFAKSADGGATWQNLTSALPPAWVPTLPLTIGRIALDPENSQTVWMSINALGAPSVFMSSDGGQHWQDVHDFQAFFVASAANPGATGANVFVDPTDSSRVYVCCTYYLGQNMQAGAGVFRSEDAGKTWTAGGPGIQGQPVLNPRNPSTLYAPGAVSTDYGDTWSALPTSPLTPTTRAGNLAIDSSGGLYQAFDYGTLLHSTNGGTSWTALSGPWLEDSSILALDPVNPASTIYVGNVSPGVEHAFLAKLDPSGNYLWATVFGGSQTDSAQAIALDAAGNPYVAGVTNSADFPVLNAFQPVKGGASGDNNDVFVTHFNSNGQMVYSSFLGGSMSQTVAAIAVDAAGNAYVAGTTASADFPTVAPLQATQGFPLATGFVAKVASSGGALVYSTYVGGSDEFAQSTVTAIAVTPQGGLWVTGTTSSMFLPLVGAIQPSNAGGSYLAEIDPTGTSWDFSTYWNLSISTMAPLANGNLWLAVPGSVGNLNLGAPPTTPTGVPLILSAYNSASFSLSDTVAPGEAVTLFGEELAPGAQSASGYPLPATMQGVSVTVGGMAAPLYYVSSGQINLQVPYGVPVGSATLVVTNGSQTGQRALTVAATAPGIFTATGDGNSAEAYIVHTADYSRVTQTNPAKAGEYLAIFCTGLGVTTPPATAGQAAGTAMIQAYDYVIANSPDIYPSYAGLAPGYAGLYQVNFQIPANQSSGMAALYLAVGYGSSQLVPIWVQ